MQIWNRRNHSQNVLRHIHIERSKEPIKRYFRTQGHRGTTYSTDPVQVRWQTRNEKLLQVMNKINFKI